MPKPSTTFTPRLAWPEFKKSFLSYCRRKRKAARLARQLAEPVIEDVEIPASVMREIDEEF